jgi:hypothetical protein
MLSEVVIKELTAKHEPLFIIQWGLFPSRLSLKLWPFENERVLCLNNLVHSLYLVGDRHTTSKSGSPAFQSGISIRWIGQFLTPAFWGNLQHACMNSDVSHYALRGLQRALNLDEEKKITQWMGSHTEKHLESVVFHLVCVEILQVFMLPNDEQARTMGRTATISALQTLLRRIGENRLFCLHHTPIQMACLVQADDNAPPPATAAGGTGGGRSGRH